MAGAIEEKLRASVGDELVLGVVVAGLALIQEIGGRVESVRDDRVIFTVTARPSPAFDPAGVVQHAGDRGIPLNRLRWVRIDDRYTTDDGTQHEVIPPVRWSDEHPDIPPLPSPRTEDEHT